MAPNRLWGSADGPDDDWVKPHVLWLPQNEPQVLEYFGRLREIVERYADVIAPIADENLHLTVQSVEQLTLDVDTVAAPKRPVQGGLFELLEQQRPRSTAPTTPTGSRRATSFRVSRADAYA